MNVPESKAAASSKCVILIVEDDRALREGLSMNLRMEGYETLLAEDGDAGMRMAFDAQPDLIILDIMMPGWSGLDILEELRDHGDRVPVLILSARKTTPDKVDGLDRGADDYMTKPFDLPELLARVKRMLCRQQSEAHLLPPIVSGDLVIDRAARSVCIGTQPLELSAKEFDILCLLAAAPNHVFTRDAILRHVWGWDYEGTSRTVDNYIATLRKKIAPSHCEGQGLRTVPRVGYRWGR